MSETSSIEHTAREVGVMARVFEPTTPQDDATLVWQHAERGLHLYRGDALRLLCHAKSETFDLIFADPPYFLSNGGVTCRNGRMVSVDKGAWDKAESFEEMHHFNMLWLRECRRLLKPHGTIWVSGTNHNIFSVGYALQTLGFKILNDIAWHKVNPPPNLACRYFTHAHETLLWARRSPKDRHLFHYDAMKRDNGGKQMQSVWHIMPPAAREKRFGKHPTQKPEALLDRIIRASTDEGALVLDPFCGSATTGVVCARLSRKFVGFDLEAAYLQLAVQRLRDVLLEQPVLLQHQLSLSDLWRGRETWDDIVRAALDRLGGEGHLREINEIVGRNPRTQQSATWPCTVRRVVRQSEWFMPVGSGRYRLRPEAAFCTP